MEQNQRSQIQQLTKISKQIYQNWSKSPQILNNITIYYSRCSRSQRGIQNTVIYTFKTPSELVCGISHLKQKNQLISSILQSQKLIQIHQISSVILSQKQKNTIIIKPKQKKQEQWQIQFETENQAAQWKNNLTKLLQLQEKKSCINLIHGINFNFALSLIHSLKPKKDEEQFNLLLRSHQPKTKQIAKLVQLKKYDSSLVKEILNRQQNLQTQINALKQKLQNSETLTKTQYQKNKKEKAQIHQKCQKLQKKVEQINFQKQLQVTIVEKVTKQKQMIETKLNKQNHSLLEKLDFVVKKSQTLEKQLASLQKDYNKQKQQNLIQRQKIKQNQKQLEGYKMEKEILQKQLNKINANNQQLMKIRSQNDQKLKKSQKLNSSLQRQKDNLQNVNNRQQADLRQKDEAIQLYQQKIRQLQNLLLQKQKQAISDSFLHIFQGQVLHENLPSRQFLRNQIQKYTNKEIKRTKLLYKPDLKNETNYHHYFDSKQNICLVVKLKNGRLIAGFSISPFEKDKVAHDGGIILSLTENKTFQVMGGKRSVTYDTYFMIFGNSELRLKHADSKFFTNFGIANNFYDSNGEKYTVLIGDQPERQVPLESYEIFQVIFK